MKKIIVHYMTEFGGKQKYIELEDIIDFSKKFKIISLRYEE